MNCLLFYSTECQLIEDTPKSKRFHAVLKGERASYVQKRHEITNVGIQVKCGILDGLMGVAKLENYTKDKMEFTLNLTQEPPLSKKTKVVIGIPRPQTVKKIIQVVASFGITEIHFVRFEKSIKSYCYSKVWEKASLDSEILESLEQVCDTSNKDIKKWDNSKDFFKDQFFSWINANKKIYLFDGRMNNLLGKLESECILVFGPEAGFTQKELEYFTELKIDGISLGDRMFRLEHALLYGLSIVN